MQQQEIQFEIVSRRIEYIQIKDFSWEFVRDYFTEWDVDDKIFMIFDGEEYHCLIEDYYFRTWNSATDIQFFLNYGACKLWLEDEKDSQRAYQLFMERPYIKQIPIKKPQWNAGNTWNFFDARAYSRTNVNELVNEYIKVRNELRGYGVHAFCVKYPRRKELKRNELHEKWVYGLTMSKVWEEDMRERTQTVLPYLTNKSYCEVKDYYKSEKIYKDPVGCEARKIFMVGPCIVTGEAQLEGEDLPNILYRGLQKLGMQYEIIRVRCNATKENVYKKILEYDICANDIVIFLERFGKEYDLDLTDYYSHYSGKEWLYQDTPSHTTERGNEIVANAIIENIVKRVWKAEAAGADEEVLHCGTPQLSYAAEEKIVDYINGIKCDEKNAGAVVVNCNPFTKGHRYLIEYALSKVDFLYVFVVEEDLSDFSFEDRLSLVKEGTKDLSRLRVVPSGRFIASKDTFRSYFERYQVREEIDVSKDVRIFAKYIAPKLGIRKRFVGEEPVDLVTNLYNEEMKRVLPQYGIELVEIPRKEIDGSPVSAKLVREKFRNKDWVALKHLLPDSTLQFLMSYDGRIDLETGSNQEYVYGKGIKEDIYKLLHEHTRFLIYGVGKDTSAICEALDQQDRIRIEFCDKKAEMDTVYFNGKRVVAPKELREKYADYFILIGSTSYGRQIYRELIHMGINEERIHANMLAAKFWQA